MQEISKCADCRIIIHRISHELWGAGYMVRWITRVWWMYVPTRWSDTTQPAYAAQQRIQNASLSRSHTQYNSRISLQAHPPIYCWD